MNPDDTIEFAGAPICSAKSNYALLMTRDPAKADCVRCRKIYYEVIR